MIKINDINKNSELNQAKGARKSGGGPSFSAYLSETMKNTANPVNSTGGIAIADAVLAAQMVNGEEEREIRRRLVKRGSLLIEKLEEIRDSLLVGEISRDKLIDISRMVKEKQTESSDTKLQEIMAEIELRVEVELAKLTR